MNVQNVQEAPVEQVYSTHKGENWKCLRRIGERGEKSLESSFRRKEGEVKGRREIFRGGLAEEDIRGKKN